MKNFFMALTFVALCTMAVAVHAEPNKPSQGPVEPNEDVAVIIRALNGASSNLQKLPNDPAFHKDRALQHVKAAREELKLLLEGK